MDGRGFCAHAHPKAENRGLDPVPAESTKALSPGRSSGGVKKGTAGAVCACLWALGNADKSLAPAFGNT